MKIAIDYGGTMDRRASKRYRAIAPIYLFRRPSEADVPLRAKSLTVALVDLNTQEANERWCEKLRAVIPSDARIVAIRYEPETNSIGVAIESDTFPVVGLDDSVPEWLL